MRPARAGLRIVFALATALAVADGLLVGLPHLRRGRASWPGASYVRSLGENGPGKLEQPIGVAVSDEGEIFVSSSGDHRIVVFGRDGSFRRSFGREGSGPGELGRPMNVSIGRDQLLYVAEYLNDRISLFQLDGRFVRHVTAQGLDAPAAAAVDARGVLYLANFYGHDILVVSADGTLLGKWGHAGRLAHGELHYPTDVAFAPDGSLWVADAYNNRLQRFVGGRSTDIAGWDPVLRTFGFRVATAVAADAAGRVYGSDFGHGQVRVFDGSGVPIGSFGDRGRGTGQFDRPEGVAVRGSQIYVADFGNGRVQQWRLADASLR
jgi:DNA-binding beta-propeller fold protein YncE